MRSPMRTSQGAPARKVSTRSTNASSGAGSFSPGGHVARAMAFRILRSLGLITVRMAGGEYTPGCEGVGLLTPSPDRRYPCLRCRVFGTPRGAFSMRKLLVASLFVVTACGTEVTTQATSAAILVRYDLSSGNIPLPNDIVRSLETGKLEVPIDPASSAAQQEFNRYLNTLTGFPNTSPITIPTSGPISESTLTESTVAVIDLTTGELVG